jgi:hypothetical protein
MAPSKADRRNGVRKADLILLVLCSFLVICLTDRATSRADGLLYRLPADGAWVKYAMKVRFAKPKDKNVSFEGFLTLASVGVEQVSDEPCRWIEVAAEAKQQTGNGGEQRSVFKALIPEKHLKKGENPLRYWIKGWAKLGDQEPQRLTKMMLSNPAVGINLVVAGPLENAKAMDEKLIETKLGKLACQGVSGTLTFPGAAIRFDNGKVATKDLTLRVQTYLHDKAPYGVVASNGRVAFPDLGMGESSAEWELILDNVGSGAKSQLPWQK